MGPGGRGCGSERRRGGDRVRGHLLVGGRRMRGDQQAVAQPVQLGATREQHGDHHRPQHGQAGDGQRAAAPALARGCRAVGRGRDDRPGVVLLHWFIVALQDKPVTC